MIKQALSDLATQIQTMKPEEKSEISKLRELMEFQRELQAQAPQRNEPAISDRDRTLLTLMRETGAAHEFFRAMRELIATPEQAAEPERWKDKLMEVASQNPQIIERVSSTLERIVARVLPIPPAVPAANATSPTRMVDRTNPNSSQTRTASNSAPPSGQVAQASTGAFNPTKASSLA